VTRLAGDRSVVVRRSGKGTVEGRVEAHAIASLEFEGATDQSCLKETLAELRQVNPVYPFRH
jgi:hypothetical protein